MAITRLVTLRLRSRFFSVSLRLFARSFSWFALTRECRHSGAHYRWGSECWTPPQSYPPASGGRGRSDVPVQSLSFDRAIRESLPDLPLVRAAPESWHPVPFPDRSGRSRDTPRSHGLPVPPSRNSSSGRV